MTEKQIKEWKDKIDAMSREQMCRLWRFAPSGHPCFVIGNDITEHFEKRFQKLGGFSVAISKKLG